VCVSAFFLGGSIHAVKYSTTLLCYYCYKAEKEVFRFTYTTAMIDMDERNRSL